MLVLLVEALANATGLAWTESMPLPYDRRRMICLSLTT